MNNAGHDIVVRNGLVVDGTGAEPHIADVAIRDGVIVAIGDVAEPGREEIDARGCIVTPGFVDVHTHYDGQITWENTLQPSSGHGVTTVVMGNCGVGFAPVKSDQHDMVVKLMEGVEDIPEVVMTTGVPWNWETFPEYLQALEQRHADIDFAAQLPHNPLRVYVMGERGAALEPPTDDDLAQMRKLTTEAIEAGALGVSTTRNLVHRFRSGQPVPSTNSEVREILALASGLRDAGTGVFQLLNDPRPSAAEQLDILRAIAQTSGRPVSFTLMQLTDKPGEWRELLRGLEQANAEGLVIRGQVLPRPTGTLLGLDLSLNPFAFHPSFRALEKLSLEDKVAALRHPELRRRLLAESSADPHPYFKQVVDDVDSLYPLGNPPNYHPAPEESVAARARAQGLQTMEVIYDELLKDEGRAMLYRPAANREGERFESSGQNLVPHEHTILGLGDGGAHYSMICDAAYTTYFLIHWVGHPDPDKRVGLPEAIRMLSRDPAHAVGLGDRGVIEVGAKGDVNVIQLDRLRLESPFSSYDLPAGGRRLTQRAEGYAATIVSGVITYRDGQATGALPGRLVRGARQRAVLNTLS